MEGVGWRVSPRKGCGLEQADGEEAGDEVADDADLAQKEEAGLPRHVDEGHGSPWTSPAAWAHR